MRFLSHEGYRKMYVCLENEMKGGFWQRFLRRSFNLGIRRLPVFVTLRLREGFLEKRRQRSDILEAALLTVSKVNVR